MDIWLKINFTACIILIVLWFCDQVVGLIDFFRFVGGLLVLVNLIISKVGFNPWNPEIAHIE